MDPLLLEDDRYHNHLELFEHNQAGQQGYTYYIIIARKN